MYNFSKQTILEFDPSEDYGLISPKVIDLKDLGPLHYRLNELIDFTSANHQPIVRPTQIAIPDEINALYRIVHKKAAYGKVCPHFFTSDKKIDPVWTQPIKYAKTLKSFGMCISPDFSLFSRMVRDQKHWNCFRNKFLSALWQQLGIQVIPAPSWGDLVDLDFYLEGWPKKSIIAINSTGIGHDKQAQYIFLQGYHRACDYLCPTHILRYGIRIEGEYTDISTYYPNDNRKEVAHGS